jgi:flagellar basal body-associated protein FliL
MASKPKAVEKESASEAAEDTDGAAAPKKKLPLKLIAVGVVGLLVVGGGGYFGYSMLFGHKEAKAAAPIIKPAVFVDLPEILVNLSSGGSDRTQYLKIKMTLELADDAARHRHFPNLSSRIAAVRSRRFRRSLSAQGRADPSCQRNHLAKPCQCGAVQGDRHSVTS